MNIKALIKKYEELWNEHSPFYEPVPYTSMVELFLKELKQLDEPEKVKVPQFVDDVIKGAREHSPELEDALHYACSNGRREFTEWYQKKSNRDLFARAWLDGYEVEKEKRYYVRFKWIEEAYSYLTFIKRFDAWTLKDITLDKKFRTAHTRKELEEAGFDWVFDCPGIAIEEVEE
ncbi:Protein of uncharacterised function (DUF1642) [Streptococcus pneumoniae]|uniref:Protein of uncharacterized function (DUF1642) n=1 Tax=Streptococcus pneumoniae TaxID=1313 RepID=A0AAJ5PBF2_STREE|nr:Protein of uncharacterised function (DUF1642) [Streptococcus pneumoniae]